eukprot:g616.t1
MTSRGFVDQLSENHIAELREAFALFDRDGDGTISVDELGTVVSSLGQVASQEDLETMLKIADADGNGVIDFPEFLTMMAPKMVTQDEDFEIKEAFEIFSQGEKFISEEKLKEIMSNLGEIINEQRLMDLIEEADYDGDGKIDYEDFRKCMKKVPRNKKKS